MSWHPGGQKRCASATYAGRFVAETDPGGFRYFDDGAPLTFSVGGNARQRRRRVREMRRQGFRVSVGGVAS